MLHMKFSTNGKVLYAFQPRDKNSMCEASSDGLYPIPIITSNHHSAQKQIRIRDWYAKNARNIVAVITIYMDALQDFLAHNPQYVCYIKEEQLRSNLLVMLHQCSHSTFKNYPSL